MQERNFSQPANNTKLFLEKKKQQKNQLLKDAKRIENIVKMQSAIRAVLVRQKILKPIVDRAIDHVPLVIIKKQESTEEKFAKIMSNAVYKMPQFFQALLYINSRNFTKHRKYLCQLVECLSSKVNYSWPVIGTILQKKKFPFIRLPELVKYAIIFLKNSPDQFFEMFIKVYLKQCELNQTSDQMDKVLSSSQIARIVASLFFQNRVSIDTQQILMNHALLQYPNHFFFLSNEQCIILCLRFPFAVTTEFLSAHKLVNFNISSSFLLSESSETLHSYYQESIILLKHELNSNIPNILKLQFALFVTGLTLQRYRDAMKGDAYLRFYKRRYMIETEDNQEELNDVWSRSVQYAKFIKNIDLSYFSKELSKIIVQIISQVRQVQSNQFPMSSLFDMVANLNITILQILTGNFIQMKNLCDKQLILALYQTLNRLDIKNVRLRSQTVGAKTLYLFIFILERLFTVMDDYEFTHQQLSYSKEVMYNIIMLTLRVVFQLIVQGKNPKNKLIFDASIKLINNIYQKNFRTRYFSPTIFEGENLSRQLKNFKINAKSTQNLVRQLDYIPFVVDLQTRYDYFWEMQREKRKYTPYQGQVTVRRGHYFRDAFLALADKDINGYHFRFVDQFAHTQEAIDGGGPRKEFINRVCRQMFQAKNNFFIQTANKELIPNGFSTLPLQQFQFAGKLIGKAMFDKIAIEFRFSGIFLNRILDRKNTLQDLQFYDRQIYQNLMILKRTNVEGLDLNFTVVDSYNNEKGEKCSRITELREHGSMIPVTQENKIQFIMDYADYKINKLGFRQSQAFKKGFVSLIDSEQMKLFNHDELNKIISGMQTEIDFKDLRRCVIYEGYRNSDDYIQGFWKVLSELKSNQKEQFLMFVTACSRPPLFGFKQLVPSMRIFKTQSIDNLPMAHTCGNILKLPKYPSQAILRQKLLLAIEHNTGYGFG